MKLQSLNKNKTINVHDTSHNVCSAHMALSQAGSVAERSKALVLGTSLFGGVGSNPTAATIVFFLCFFFRGSG